MQNPPTDRYTSSPSRNAYSPSVPISVYRELAAELQAAQAMLDSLNNQNQQLVKQNQQLRDEVTKVLQSAQHLQQVVDSFRPTNGAEVPRSKPVVQPEPRPVPPPPRPSGTIPVVEFPPPHQEPPPVPPPYRETMVIEHEEPRPRRTSHSEGVSDVSGWVLVLAILLIVLTAFGTGFLIVRPLLNNNNR